MSKIVLYFFYRPVYLILKTGLLLTKPLLNLKVQKWIELRQIQSPAVISGGLPVFLFHASSGEIEYVKSLIRDLKQSGAQIYIVVSYSSPSALKLFENIKPYVNQFVPVPWDQPEAIKHFIKQINPESVIFARTDLWPEFLFQLNQKSIRKYVVAFNPSFSWMNQYLIKNFLNHFTAIFCVHTQQVIPLQSLIPKNVEVIAAGDTRYDQVFWRLQQSSKINIESDFPFGVLGSTWPQDEAMITPELKNIVDHGYKIFWSPHEINRSNIEQISAILFEKKLNFILSSKIDKSIPLNLNNYDVVLIDEVGFLADVYRQADWAFVGGSFKSKVHSVMEPLCCAVPIMTGPKIHNSPESLKYSQMTINNLKVVQIILNSQDFVASIEKIRSTSLPDFKKILIGNVEQNRHATRKILQFIVRKTQENLNS